jgi:uncharacterized membrane protein YccC
MVFDSRLGALAAGIGAVTIGPTSRRGAHRTRIATMLAASFGMAVGACVAGYAGPSTVALIAVTAVAAYASGLFASLGDWANSVGLNAMVPIVILGNIGTPVSQVLGVSGWVLAGALCQTALVVLSWPFERHGAERRALADAYRSLAAYARSLHATPHIVPPHQSLATVRSVLSDPQPFVRRSQLLAMQTLADEVERIRGTLGVLAATDATNDPALLAATGALLDEVANAVERSRRPIDQADWAVADARVRDDPQWERLYGQLRSAWRSASLPQAAGARTAFGASVLEPHIEHWLSVLRENVSIKAPFGRHAVRLAVVLSLALLLYREAHIARGYWIVLTALLVLRPDFHTTFSRGVARVAGTIGGVLIASLVAFFVPSGTWADLAVAIAFAGLGFVVFPINWALYTVTVTVFVVFMLSLAGLAEPTAAAERIVATLIGGAMGLTAYAIWPTWESRVTRPALAELLETLRSSSISLLAAFSGDGEFDREEFTARRRTVWRLRNEIDASIERMLSEPSATHDMPPSQALTIFASTQRYGLANLALSTALATPGWRPVPEVREFAAALDRAMHVIAEAVRTGEAPNGYPDLRAAHSALQRAVAAKGEPATRGLIAQCDLYVDSANTIEESL